MSRPMNTTRRSLLGFTMLAPLALASPARAQSSPYALAQTAQDKADIARIEAYMNGVRSLKARFLQVSPNGSTAEGVAYIVRPGRMRFEYDPPSPFLLVAGSGLVVFHDNKLDQTSNFPLSETPLGILLSDNLKLSGDVTVTAISRQPGAIQVTTIRTKTPGDGTLTLVFADNPLALKQWSVVDAQRQETRVSLFDVQLGGTFDPSLFNYTDMNALRNGTH
jgi:outer membrane lipoprotein-sorting protein